MTTETKHIRERSGEVNSNDPLVAFLYILIRDHVLPGDLEAIMKNMLPKEGDEALFCNGWIATYAKDLAERLSVK